MVIALTVMNPCAQIALKSTRALVMRRKDETVSVLRCEPEDYSDGPA